MSIQGEKDMMILPIIQKGKVIHVSVSLPCKKIRKGLRCKGIEQSEIIVNRQKFSESSFSDSKDVKSTTDFIRTFSLLYPRKFLVVTSSDINSHLYDVYELNPPAEKVNDNLDALYGKLITDLRKEIPGVVARGRYVSFRNLGFDDYFDESRIARLKMVVDNVSDTSLRTQLFQKEGVNDLVSFVDFLSDFKYTVLDDYSLNIDSLKEVLHTLSNINTRDYRNLKRYYEIAKTNTDILKKVSYVFEVVYDKPFTEERFFVKRKEKKEGTKNDYLSAA